MKKIITMLVVFVIAMSAALPVYAADGKVTYSGNAGSFVFEPGSEHSLTDLFPNFKGVMPGDILTQKITVKNNADNKVKVKIYIRSLGADPDSVDFLSQLHLRVEKIEEPETAYMFDAAPSQTAQLTDWVCLGTLYSGGEADLNVILEVPAELENKYSHRTGALDWEFKVEEFPVEEDDPKPPPTKDNAGIWLWASVGLGAVSVVIVLILWHRKKQEEN